MPPQNDQDPRAVLHDIIKDFESRLAKWVKREVGHSQFASTDCPEHLAALEGLMSILCAQYDISAPHNSGVDEIEVQNPGR
jgi:hypothetical protein